MSKHHDCLHKHANKLLSMRGVYAVGLGEKVSNGHGTGKQAIVCSIAKKKPTAQLTPEDVIPADLDGVPTDIVEIGDRPRAFPTWQDKVRPVTPGTSAGHHTITAGTIGAVVSVDGKAMLLSNNHVFADTNLGKIGDAIIQPGKYDGGKDTDRIGILYWYVPLHYTTQTTPTPPPTAPVDPLPPAPGPTEPPPPGEDSQNILEKLFRFVGKIITKLLELLGLKDVEINGRSATASDEPSLSAIDIDGANLGAEKSTNTLHQATAQVLYNKVDAALCLLDPGMAYTTNYLGFIPSVEGVNELAGVDTAVQKLGRTTGHTLGKIKQTNVIVDVQYDGGICRFEDQICIVSDSATGKFSAGGDSGSLILDLDNKAVGLLFAGNDVTTFANPIAPVMSELKITKFL